MAFYLKSPTGSCTFNKLHNFVMKRVMFLYFVQSHPVDDITKIIEQETLTEQSDCLLEGTVKDKISHFTLRLLCSSNPVMQNFLLQSEIKLFDYRLNFYDFFELRHVLQKAYKQSQYILQNKCYILKSYEHALKSVINIAEKVEFAVEKGYSFIKVHFTSALKFVEKRSYRLHMGYINLPLKDFKVFLLCLFEETLFEGLNQMKISQCIEELKDPRMSYMHQKIKTWLFSRMSNSKILYHQSFAKMGNIATESLKFPLCMQNLQNQLSKNHRLKHLSRIQYTLFLKEIGVPCSDVINLFMREYSMPVQLCQSSYSHCSHNWADSEKRYIYSIEHLYGMRGARKNYKAHNCETLQSMYDNVGGCPFIAYDDQHLQKTLENQCLKVKDIEDIISKVHKEKYQEACSSYLVHKLNIHHIAKKSSLNYCTNNSLTRRLSLNTFQQLDVMLSDSTSTEEKSHFISNMHLKITYPSDFYTIFSYVDS